MSANSAPQTLSWIWEREGMGWERKREKGKRDGKGGREREDFSPLHFSACAPVPLKFRQGIL